MAVEVRGSAQFRAGMLYADKQFRPELRKLMRTAAANPARDRARARANARGGMQARSATSIQSGASPEGARLRIAPTAQRPMANIAFWGARRRTGWYSRGRYANSPTAQFPAWVGNTWEVGSRSEGPYSVNAAIADVLPKAEQDILAGIVAIYDRAFPN